MYSKVLSISLQGLRADIVNVEVDVGGGLPGFEMSGFLALEVKEARERVRVAIKNTGINLNPQKIVVNISPADIRKDGTGFDLPIAIAILMANSIVNYACIDKVLIIGELSLNGDINGVRGVLSSVIEAKNNGMDICIVPRDNYLEARIVKGIDIVPVNSLKEVIDFLNNGTIPEYTVDMSEEVKDSSDDCKTNSLTNNNAYNDNVDFDDIKGQNLAKRAAAIAVAGMHNIMFVGPPGSGKTMIAKRMPTIMPSMTFEEQLALTNIYSVAGQLEVNSGLMDVRPFRAPYHNVTKAAFLGGGSFPKPGEITLAGKGVLFLDEMTEFRPDILESLRQPLEDKQVTIVRLNNAYTYPADFMLVGAINPCKCGYYPDRNRCNCSELDIKRYLGRISMPIWDRFDICIRTQEVRYEDINKVGKDENYTSKNLKHWIDRARKRQMSRFINSKINYNSEMHVKEINQYCNLGTDEADFMKNMYEKKRLTARGYHKILKTARTIADMEDSTDIKIEHLTEACLYRDLPTMGGE